MEMKMSKFSYQKLRKEVISQEEDDEAKKEGRIEGITRLSFPRISWFGNKLRKKKVNMKISGFRKLFKIRSRIKVARFRLSWANKVLKRLKESKSHFGELFAGNYMFMQVTPASFKNNKYNICVGNPYYNCSNTNHKFASFAPFTFMY